MMKTADEQVSDALDELRAMTADYLAMKENWLRERRMILDTLIANCELRTLEIILTEYERTSCAWERWPAAKGHV
jgi:hypothetical protein